MDGHKYSWLWIVFTWGKLGLMGNLGNLDFEKLELWVPSAFGDLDIDQLGLGQFGQLGHWTAWVTWTLDNLGNLFTLILGKLMY